MAVTIFARSIKNLKTKVSCRLCSSECSTNPIIKLKDRGLYQELFPNTSEKNINNLLNKNPQCVYAGFDPTADSLHIGSLLVLMNLLHWQRNGHHVLTVLGGATGLIGDPSHRTKERDEIDEEVLNKNIQGIKRNIETIFSNHAKYFWKENKPLQPVTVLNNKDWYQDLKAVDFIRNIGKHFRLGTMLLKASVQARLNSESGMSYTEFTYQIFQAYDWLQLLNKYSCHFQVGGGDQMGNIMSGHELITRTTKKDVYGFLLPLITSEGGKKFGKSLNNAVWLSPERSSSFELYQFFMRTKDSDVESYLKFFTFLPLEEIEQIVENHKKSPEKHEAQKILAENTTLLVHGETGLQVARKVSSLLYESSVEILSTMEQEELLQVFQNARMINMQFDANLTVFKLAVNAKCFKTENDAKRIIKAGGFYVNFKKIVDENEPVLQDIHILPNKITLLRTGKKTYHIVRWISESVNQDLKVAKVI